MTHPTETGGRDRGYDGAGQVQRQTVEKSNESPTNVRNGKDIMIAIGWTIAEDRYGAIIRPQGQMVFLDYRQPSFWKFSAQVSIFGLKAGNADRWLARSMEASNGRVQYEPRLPPSPQTTARLMVGSNSAALLKEKLHMENKATAIDEDNNLVHLLLIRGASAAAVQSFRFAFTASQALAVAFHELSNGYSVTLVGTILHCDKDRLVEYKTTWARCSTVKELDELYQREREAKNSNLTAQLVSSTDLLA